MLFKMQKYIIPFKHTNGITALGIAPIKITEK
jgi:hypothetical protein